MIDMQMPHIDGSWQRSGECVSHPVEDSLVILDIQSGEYVALNETAAAVWDLIDTPIEFNAIVDSLTATYEVERAVCADAVRKVLTTLRDKGLIRSVS